MKDADILKKFCPFTKEPYEECYCNNLSSQTIENILYYCGNNFEKCNLFKKMQSASVLLRENKSVGVQVNGE